MVVARRRKYASRYRRRGSYARRWRRWGVTKSWTNGTRNFKVLTRITHTVTFTIEAGRQVSDAYVVTPWSRTAGAYIGPTGSTNYQRWTQVFDEVRCNWMTVTVNPTIVNAPGSVGRAIQMAVDRKFMRNEQAFLDGNIFNSANVVTKRFNSNTASQARVFVGANNLEERTKYHDSTINSDHQDAQWDGGADVGFAPGVYLMCTTDAPVTAATTISFVVEAKIEYTFRNIKYA